MCGNILRSRKFYSRIHRGKGSIIAIVNSESVYSFYLDNVSCSTARRIGRCNISGIVCRDYNNNYV